LLVAMLRIVSDEGLSVAIVRAEPEAPFDR
jgi:hypothetical protein